MKRWSRTVVDDVAEAVVAAAEAEHAGERTGAAAQ